MKSMYALVAGLLCSAQFSTAAVWRLNNTEGAHANFTDIQLAINGAETGDTIYVEGSAKEYVLASGTDITLNKKLHIIGPGYFLGSNDSLIQPEFRLNAVLPRALLVKPGAEGSIIEGIYFGDQLRVSASDITIRNNYFNANAYIGFDKKGYTGIVFTQNYMGSLYIYDGEAIIKNNIINSITMSSGLGPLKITNNTITSTSTSTVITANNSHIANNIMIGTIKASATNMLENNQTGIISSDYLANFVESTSTDGKWQLRKESTFYTAATDGGQCGAFGGSTPYELSGLPQVPQIYQVNTSGTATESMGMHVTLKIKTAK